jgi:parvulin-like peptidyl-prolyl isomerase
MKKLEKIFEMGSIEKPHHLVLVLLIMFFFSGSSGAETVDKVVAFINDYAITLRELNASYDRARASKPDISRQEVLNTMINRQILLNEAKRLRIQAENDEDIMGEYIDLKITAFVKVSEEELRRFYEENREELGAVRFDAVQDSIEQYLREREINIRLKRHIEELRAKSHIKVFFP